MSNPWPVFIPVVAAVWVAWMAFVIWLGLHRYNTRSPKWIVKRLTETGTPYSVAAAYTRGVWNPAKPIGVDNLLFDKGMATYWLDESGLVHLDFKSSSDHDQHLVEPIPEVLVHPTVHQQHGRALMRRVLIGYLSFLILGVAIGASVTTGNVADHILGGGVGLLLALGIAVILVRVLRVGNALRKASQEHEQ